MDNKVAQTIINQIGNKAIAMIGAKNFSATKSSLIFQIGKNPNKITHIEIILTDNDLYDINYYRITHNGLSCKKIACESGIYFDMLTDRIAENTGLLVTL